MSDLEKHDVRHLMTDGANYADAIWRLYDAKAGMETYYKDRSKTWVCATAVRERRRNAGFYAVAALAHTLATAVDLIGGKSAERGSKQRKDGGKRRRALPRRMRCGACAAGSSACRPGGSSRPGTQGHVFWSRRSGTRGIRALFLNVSRY